MPTLHSGCTQSGRYHLNGTTQVHYQVYLDLEFLNAEIQLNWIHRQQHHKQKTIRFFPIYFFQMLASCVFL